MGAPSSVHRDELHQIGTVAERVGLSLRTIRHYDDVGLVTPSGRSAGGFRLYTDVDVDRLAQVKAMKPLGFTLSESHEVLDLMANRGAGHVGVERATRLAALAERARAHCVEQQDRLDRAMGFVEQMVHGTTAGATAPDEEMTWR